MALYANGQKVCPTINPDSNYFHSTIRIYGIAGNYVELSNGMTGNIPASGTLDFYIYKPGNITVNIYVQNSTTPAISTVINVTSSAIQTYLVFTYIVADIRFISYIGATVTFRDQTFTIESFDGVTVSAVPIGTYTATVTYDGHTRTHTIEVSVNCTICEFLNPYTLPSDYTEVGSIYMNNIEGSLTLASHKCYIDTEDHYKLNDIWIFKLRNFENVTSNRENKGYGGGCKTSTAYNITGGGRLSSGTIASYFSGSNVFNINSKDSSTTIQKAQFAGKLFTEIGSITSAAIINDMYVYGLSLKNGYYRARLTSYTKANYPGPDSILIGCDNTNTYAYGSNENVYYYVYIEGTTVSKAMYPAKRNSDNIYGLYDVINDIFYTNDGSGGESYITEGVD